MHAGASLRPVDLFERVVALVEPLDARVGGVGDEEVVRQAVDARGDGNELRFALISTHTPHFAAVPLSAAQRQVLRRACVRTCELVSYVFT